MANNHNLFSENLLLATIEQEKAAMKLFEEMCESDEPLNFEMSPLSEVSEDKVGLWIRHADGGSVDDVLDFVEKLGKALKLKGKWAFSWASTCDRPRVSEFGGGAATINLRNGRVEFVNTFAWLEKKMKGAER